MSHSHVFTFVAISLLSFCGLIMPAHAAEVIIQRTQTPPIIDGTLNEACWRQAFSLKGFTKQNSFNEANKNTNVRVCFDDQALYLGIVCAEPHPEQIKAVIAENGRIWEDDSVSLCFRGKGSLDVDQFQFNSLGAGKAVRLRQGVVTAWKPTWKISAKQGKKAWVLELRIPFTDLDRSSPQRGEMLPLKVSRVNQAGIYEISVWPPHATSTYDDGMGYGGLYFAQTNLLQNPTLTEKENGEIRAWWIKSSLIKGRASQLCKTSQENKQRVIQFTPPGGWSTAQQVLKLQPNTFYRLEARVHGTISLGFWVRAPIKNETPGKLFEAWAKPSKFYEPLAVDFHTGSSGRAVVALAAAKKGTVFLRGLRVFQPIIAKASGPAIPLTPNAPAPLLLRKIPVTDCRVVRGFMSAPVDGKLNSIDWDGNTWEYNNNGDAGVAYLYHGNDGLHITLADKGPVQAVRILGGAAVKLYGSGATFEGPQNAPLLHTFGGHVSLSRALFNPPLQGGKFSFFDLTDGTISDVSFFRIEKGAGTLPAPEAWRVGASTATPALQRFLNARFEQTQRSSFRLVPGNPANPVACEVPAEKTIHWILPALKKETPLAAIGLDLVMPNAPTGATISVSVQDPIDPNAELMGADFALQGSGRYQFILDFSDQIIPAGTPLWLSITCDWPAHLTGVDGGAPVVNLYRIDRKTALPEALTYRKLMLKGLFVALSEQRPWNSLRGGTDIAKWLKNLPQNRASANLEPAMREFFNIIAYCKKLAPKDDTIRQYDEWVFRRQRKLPYPKAKLPVIPGAPEWAIAVHQAWLLSRAVANWWLDNRLVPTGEFGGTVNDDSCMYQNYADLVMFEKGGVAAKLKDGAARLAELAQKKTLEQGLNRVTRDPLHAYEDGLNHESMMLWWFYGDPVYVERCMIAARSSESLTTVTSLGHRHFKSNRCGAEDLRINRKLGVENGLHPLMLHPALETAWYNHNPRALKFLDEWAEGCLAHQKPGAYASRVNVVTETVISSTKLPFKGSWCWGIPNALTFLYQITRDEKYLRPFIEGWHEKTHNSSMEWVLPELLLWQALPLDDQLSNFLQTRSGMANLLLTGKQDMFLYRLKRNLATLQHFPAMYTTAEPYTDRVFLIYNLSGAARAYTGGFASRNKYNQSHAVSYAGFGTNYAALVLNASRTYFRVLLYNFSAQPIKGHLRFWTLAHGRYRLTLGSDHNENNRADKITHNEVVEIQRASRVMITLPPRQVTVLTLLQEKPLDDIFVRPDLALSSREIKIKNGVLTGIAHNIGGAAAPACIVALFNPAGKEVSRLALGALAAPLDLKPKRKTFRFAGLPTKATGWKITINPDHEFPELYNGNNEVVIQ